MSPWAPCAVELYWNAAIGRFLGLMIAVPPALVERVLPVLLESDRAPPDEDKNAAFPLLGPVSVGTVAPRGAEDVEEEADEVECEGEVEGLR